MTYPASDLDNREKLLDVVGSFWSGTFAGSDLVGSLLSARAQQDAQAHLDMLELIAAMSRFDLPVFHTDNWYCLTLTESAEEHDAFAYDGTLHYAEAFEATYGTPAPSSYHAWPIPGGLAEVKILLNRITASSLTLTHGVDFFLTGRHVLFVRNPFDDDLVPKREVFEGSQLVDRTAALWAYRGKFDWQTAYKQFGYVLGVNLPSSETYKAFLNAIFDGLVEGTTRRCVEEALGALCDVPLVREASETVESILDDGRALWVVTDKAAYAHPRAAAVVVGVGDVLHAGDVMTDALTFYEFNGGLVPDADEVRSLSVGPGLLARGYLHDLVFENVDVPLEVDASGEYTRVSFKIGGAPGDVEKFWDDVHAAGVAAGETLAMLMDRRTNKVGQPTMAVLPATVNPFGFLCQNVFRNNLFVVRVKTSLLGPNALGLHNARTLRKLIPPHTAMIILSELAVTGDEITLNGPGGEDEAGFEEAVRVFLGEKVAEEIDPADYVEESVRLRVIRGRCE